MRQIESTSFVYKISLPLGSTSRFYAVKKRKFFLSTPGIFTLFPIYISRDGFHLLFNFNLYIISLNIGRY
jgi:hypothetical protein